MSTGEIISLLLSGVAALIAALSFRRNNFHDNSDMAMKRATMEADIKYIRNSVDDIKLEYKSMQKDFLAMQLKIAEIEQSTKSAHRRLDELFAHKEGEAK